jgi:hypothetical protein
MEAGVAGFKVRRAVVLVLMRFGPMMLVRSEPMAVLRVMVIGVQVDVQRRDLARGRGQDECEQESCQAVHHHESM